MAGSSLLEWNLAQARVQAGEMHAGLVALAQQGRARQASDPGRMLERLNGVPADSGDGRGQGRRQALRLLDQAPPLREPSVLIPVGVIDQWIALARPAGLGDGEVFVGSGQAASTTAIAVTSVRSARPSVSSPRAPPGSSPSSSPASV
jgi:hypothetical protein